MKLSSIIKKNLFNETSDNILNLKSGSINIPLGTDQVDVVFDKPLNNEYNLLLTISNIVDSNPSLVASMIKSKSNSGFTAKLSAKVNTNNYNLEWLVI